VNVALSGGYDSRYLLALALEANANIDKVVTVSFTKEEGQIAAAVASALDVQLETLPVEKAAAFGKPIVASGIGAEGLEMHDGHELLLRDDVVSFSQACIDLLTDSALGQRLGYSARRVAICRNNQAEIIRRIQSHLLAETTFKQSV